MNFVMILEMITGFTAMFCLSRYEEDRDKYSKYKWYAVVLYLVCICFAVANMLLEVGV